MIDAGNAVDTCSDSAMSAYSGRMAKTSEAAEYEVISFRATPEQAERWRDACYWARLKFVDFARAALDAEAARLQKKHNAGKPFAARDNR